MGLPETAGNKGHTPDAKTLGIASPNKEPHDTEHSIVIEEKIAPIPPGVPVRGQRRIGGGSGIIEIGPPLAKK